MGTGVPGVPRRPRPNQWCYLHLWCRFSIGEPHMKASDLAGWVNKKLRLVDEDGYSSKTMVLWLHKCGFKVKLLHPCIFVFLFVSLSCSIFASLYPCICICFYPCIFVWFYLCIFVSLYLCISVFLYTFIFQWLSIFDCIYNILFHFINL